jgi:hypothetical protein
MRNSSLLILGAAYTPPVRFPRCDATWTTYSAYAADSSIRFLPNLMVWDCHDIAFDIPPNAHHVDIHADDSRDAFASLTNTHGRTFANQMCYMLADVSQPTSPFATVHMYGCAFADEDHLYQLQYITYHIGYLRALGVPVTIHQPSNILPPLRYGLDTEV